MAVILYNTLTRRKDKFVALKKIIGLYACGPTVYSYQHIGNMRAFIFGDILKRVLLFNNFKVNHVMNITDVGHLTSDADEGEDKMTKGLKREGLPLTLVGMTKLAKKYTDLFIKDLKKLNILLPNQMPKASDNIKEDVELISILEKKGFTYKIKDGIYFNTAKLADYGKLLKKKVEKNKEHQSEEHQRLINSEKKSQKDFTLWKFNDKLGWDTEYGKGFPGWHIECSVMASKYLGKQFDIHIGGQEHVSIHHTNEIAQSEAAFGKKPWVKYWLHNEWLVLAKGEKMAKSGDNFITLDVLDKKEFDSLDFRYFCLGTIYRNPLMFSYEALEGAKKARERLFDKVLEFKRSKDKENKSLQKKYINKFTTQINDDLNTPKALAVVWEMIKDDKLSGRDKYFLMLLFDKVLGFNLGNLKEDKIPEMIIKLANDREIARKNKDWVKSDKIRAEIANKGYMVEDGVKGYEVKKK